MMSALPPIQVANLDHLGLVAGMIDAIGIEEKINQLVGTQLGEKVSPGQAVKAMILNGLGLVSAPLYLFSKFFEGKATEHLIGEGIQPEHLNDDRLGRVLDKLYLTGLSQIFATIAIGAAQQFNVAVETAHLDASSFHVHGEYESNLAEVYIQKQATSTNETSVGINETAVPQPIVITYGYSRDHRPDLKQFILDLICSEDGDVPLFLRVGDGNESDRAIFPQVFRDFKKHLDLDALMVADSALYSEANLVEMATLKWLSRVPLTIKQAKELVSQLKVEAFIESTIAGYRWSQHQSHYGGIEQRWLVVESKERQESDLKRLEKNLDKAQTEATRHLLQLSRQSFACVADALKAANQLSKKLKYHQIVALDTQEIPSKSTSKNSKFSYKVTVRLELKSDVVEAERRQAGRFILATNVLDINQLNPDEMIAKYKNQQSSERGFSFLKDPLFFTDSVFLKSPERIEALALIMGLCLLVYTLAQRQLRQTLKQAQSGIKNQLGRLTERPTLRWIFQCFQAVHLLQVDSVKQVSNLTDERLRTLSFFPATCRAYYLIHGIV
jgi:transposase